MADGRFPASVLIICQAGKDIGLGHLVRSLVAARALRDERIATPHLLIQGPAVARGDLDDYPHDFVAPDADFVEAVENALAERSYHAVIFDLPQQRRPDGLTPMLQRLRNTGCKTVAIDGFVDVREMFDLIFIPAFRLSAPLDDVSRTPVVYGWDCFLLDVAHRQPESRRKSRSVLVLTGGSDATGLGRHWPPLLDKELPPDVTVDWVTGPYASPPTRPRAPSRRITEHMAPNRLDDLMIDAGYAVTVYGVSFYELLYYGVPTVVFSPYGDKDRDELAALAKERVALVATDEREAVAHLNTLMADDALADELSARAKSRMRDNGGRRFARCLADLIG